MWVPNTGTHTIRRRIQHQASARASAGPLGIQASARGSQAAGFAILPSAGSTKDATRPAAVCADSDSAAGTPSAVAGIGTGPFGGSAEVLERRDATELSLGVDRCSELVQVDGLRVGDHDQVD